MVMKYRQGFTLIELSLSLIFIGTLSVLVMLIINNLVLSYQRGMTLNQLNTVGMDLVDDMRSAIQNSSSDSVSSLCNDYYEQGSEARLTCELDGAESFTRIVKTGNVRMTETASKSEQLPVYGAFCTGSYSYIWNSGYFFDNGEFAVDGQTRSVTGAKPATLRYRIYDGSYSGSHTELVGSTDVNEAFRLLKVKDNTRAVCVSTMQKVIELSGETAVKYLPYYKIVEQNDIIPNDFNITADIFPVLGMGEEPLELLSEDDYNDLVLYDMEVARPAESSTRKNMFYAISFILGTIRGGIDITRSGNSCTPPEWYITSDFDYCSINKFNFAAQANGEITR